MNKLYIAIAVIVLLAFVLIISAPQEEITAQPTITPKATTETTTEKPDTDLLKEVMYESFMSECVSPDVNRDFCSCAFNKLFDKYGFDGFMEIADNFDRYGFDQRMEDATYDCIYWLL